ncbi:MAG TPA: radical SAM family heme chaperone HemW [Candidatus Saccharimonadales bacterium]|nr:radical SAM family heme chaperone HemW [Candidatus Saccharimonadales bacterium]
MKRLGIYVAVPFCQTKCTYCNFHTGVVSAERFGPYVEAVCAEIQGYAAFHAAAGIAARDAGEVKEVDTVYFGGGTPSLLEASDLGKVLQAIQKTFQPGLREVTLEADPETVTEEKAAAWAAAGINRVSFGVQSFVDKELVAAGRMHRKDDIYRAVPILRAAGIANISFDLIAGLAWQTRASWEESLGALVKLEPEHVSVYLLEIDEGSRLGAEILQGGEKYSAGQVPAEDVMAEFYDVAREKLAAAGYGHYEISNWARPGKQSRHNLKYWRREEYLGFGAGAHSFFGGWRWANAHDAAEYVKALSGGAEVPGALAGKPVPLLLVAAPAVRGARLPAEQLEEITAEKALEEELFLGLRQLAGIDLERIEKQYGVTLASKFDPLIGAGLLKREGTVVRLAEERLSVSNEVFVELLK